MHRDIHFTNLRNLNLTTPGESDGFCVNRQRLAVPLSVSGGQIAIIEVQPWRHTVYFLVQCGCFKEAHLAACDVFRVLSGGLH